MSVPYHEFGGLKIPICTGRSARHLYNLPDDEIDRMRCGTEFDQDSVFEPSGFRGEPWEARIPRIGDAELKEICGFRKRTGSTAVDLFRRHNVPVKHQRQRPFCWGYGATTAFEFNWVTQGRDYVELSPDLPCAEITKGRDKGGWAAWFYEHVIKRGIPPQSLVERNTRDYRRYQTPEIESARAPFKPKETVDFQPGDMEGFRSALGTGIGCGMGLSWWGHLIAFLDLDWHDRYGWLHLERNSHGPQFGSDGWAFHTEESARHGGGSAMLVSQ